MTDTDADRMADGFEEHRHHLFGVAYRMLGRVAEAEDVVQETWLRWDAADRATIERPRAWLTTVASRLAIDRLRSAQSRRESYVGPWLPEPLLTGDDDPAAHAELAESLSLAFLTMLERLDPVERAAFLLREVFGHDYDEIAETIDRSVVNCRQIVHRAKERLGPDRPTRFEADPDDERRLLDSFLAAAVTGDVESLAQMLVADVVVWSDGGAKQYAARRPVVGRDRVAMFVRGIAAKREKMHAEFVVDHARINGTPGLVAYGDGELFMTMAFDIGPDGIRGIHAVLNPDKLEHLR
ncbi:MAG: RNA polymerase sigma-70 factor [Acidimicrobiales bacterium]|nr:RNA polymerase sigma-70 factor [Acidimicrobiales bacterium]